MTRKHQKRHLAEYTGLGSITNVLKLTGAVLSVILIETGMYLGWW